MSVTDKDKDMLADLHQKSDEELKSVLEHLINEEEKVSYRRRVLHGQIDILRAELKERIKEKHARGETVITKADVQRLSKILARATSGKPKVDLGEEDLF